MAGEIGCRLLAGFLLRFLFTRRRDIARQQDAEGRPLADGAVAVDIAPGLFDDAIDHGKAEARALADFLGREKGLEDLVLHVVGDAVARVFDLDCDVVGVNKALLIEIGAFRRCHIARPQFDLAAVRHGVAGIDDEIDDDLLELIEVGLGEPKIAAVAKFECYFFADEAAHQHLQIGQDVAKLQHLRPQCLPP